MRYRLIIVLCLSSLVLCGCGLLVMRIAADNAHWTECTVYDSETNRQEVMQVIHLIADRYGFQDRTEERRVSDWQKGVSGLQVSGYTIVAHYYAAGSDKPSSDIDLDVTVFRGEVRASLYQRKWGNATKKYNEIRERFVSEFRNRFGAAADLRIEDYKIH